MGQQYFTSRLLSKIEPYYIDGIGKVSFYSEVNTNIQKNDKVFITNGYFDSEYYINKGKYVKNADGYRVLYVDRCRIVIDLDWTLLNKSTSIYYGVTQSYNIDSFDNYLKVYNIRSQREFDYINTLFVDSESSGRISKFERDISNSIIYSKDIFVGKTNDLGENSGLGAEHSFWQRVGTTWNIVTSDFLYSTFTCSNPNYNGKMIILGEDIEYGGKIFKERNIYKNIDPTTINSWVIDTESKSPIISKLYFKKGVFQGIHNDGIYGSYDHQQDWYATQSATWNGGLLVNSTWHSGSMNSKSTGNSASYYATLQNDIVIQTTDFSNNKGNGYNYVMDSNIQGGTVENGNFINCNIQDKTSLIDVIGAYYFENSIDYPLKLKGGIYQYCDISNVSISNSTTLDSIIDNTYLYNSKTLNSQLTKSHSNSGEFSINNGIAVNSAAISYYVPSYIGTITSNYTDIRGTLKLYISDSDYERLDTFDSFYISKINKDYIINSLSLDERIYLPLETRYVLDKFWNSDFDGKYCVASLKSKYENTYITNVTSNNIFDISSPTFSNYQFPVTPKASVDIDLGNYLVVISNLINNNNVDNLFRNTFISNADFRDGVADYIKWTSGSNVNYPSNIINKKSANTKLDISKIDVGKLKITLPLQPTVNNNELAQGSYIWLDSIQHTNNSGTVDITGAYKVIGITNSFTSREITILGLTGVNTLDTYDKVNSYTNYSSSTYSVSVDLPKYVSISGLLVDNSEIKSGLFVRTLFRNSTFTNDEFNNEDLKLSNSNIDRLRFVNEILKSNNNIVKSGLVHKSHILDVTWKNGISNNSIWSGETFENGIFNSGYWIDGTFNNGYFQNSRDIILSIPDYSYKSYYKNWNDGTFNNGVFNKSVWMDGTFNNGKIYDSDWYGGVFNNGIIGDRNVPAINTNIGSSIGIGATQTFIYGGIVENAQVGGQSSVYWYDGKFNDGIFTSDNYIDSNESIWYGGEFNGGRFEKLARWKDGTFNNGKFISYYGWQLTSTYSTDFGWEFGKFNGGEFGNGSYATNSMWFDGEFNGGLFQGRVWNNGVFMNGTFNGGGTISAVSDESSFVESFTSSYYGLWKNGCVTNIKHKYIPDQLVEASDIRHTQTELTKIVTLKDVLWLNGYFDHPNGTAENTAWLNGHFIDGFFKQSVFNPYIKNHWGDGIVETPGVAGISATASITITSTASVGDNITLLIDGNQIGFYGPATGLESTTDIANDLYSSVKMWADASNYGVTISSDVIIISSPEEVGMAANQLVLSYTYSTYITNEVRATSSVDINTTYPGMTTSFEANSDINISIDNSYVSSLTYSSDITLVSDIVDSINSAATDAFGYTASIVDANNLTVTYKYWFGSNSNGRTIVFSNLTDSYTFSFGGGLILATSSYIKNNIIGFTGGVDNIDPTYGDSFNFDMIDCIWENGKFEDSLFYISDWKSGEFISGTMSGAKWKNGIWKYGYAKNIYWEDGTWENGTWEGSPFDYTNLNYSNRMLSGKDSDILLRVSNIMQDGKLHIVNAFRRNEFKGEFYISSTGFTYSNTYSPSWGYNSSYNGIYVGTPYGTSDILYAFLSGTTSIFNQEINHDIVISLKSCNAAQTTSLRSDVIIKIGDNTYKESVLGRQTFRYSYTPVADSDPRISVQRVNYNNPDNSILIVEGTIVKIYNAIYDDTYNNKLYQFSSDTSFTYGATGTTISLPSTLLSTSIDDGKLVTIKYGNGVFKSGVWKNGYWNNGWRSVWNNTDKDYIIFDDIISGSDIRISPNTWNIKLKTNNNIDTLSVGDKIAIGNIVCIDYNEDRHFIKDYHRVIAKGSITENSQVYNTITVEISSTSNIMRIVKDSFFNKNSDTHKIYVTKNIWLSGEFYSGYFKGVWNYGLFKGYPYITKMEDTQWIDGVFDGGRFISSMTSSNNVDANGDEIEYHTGLIQNFTFFDGNVGEYIGSSTPGFKYNSWIDVTYSTQSMTNILRDNVRYNKEYKAAISDGNLRGYPTEDVLSSESVFRNAYNKYHKYYKLGTKYKVYNDFIDDGSTFTYPIDSIGEPGEDEFVNYGWTHSNTSIRFHSNIGIDSDDNRLVVDYKKQDFVGVGVKLVQTDKWTYDSTGILKFPSVEYNNPTTMAYDFSDSKVKLVKTDISNNITTYSGGTNHRFSHKSVKHTDWNMKDNINLSGDINKYRVNFKSYPSGQSINDTDPLGGTQLNNRRVYMLDLFNPVSTSSTYGGYDNPGVSDNIVNSEFVSNEYGGFSYNYYVAPSDTNLTINAFIPFVFRLHEGGGRNGWSTFKIIGVVEKCENGLSLDEGNWKYMMNTKLDFYGDSGYNRNTNGRLYMDKDKCCIYCDYDINTKFLGKLIIEDQLLPVKAGDKIRFRLYIVNVRKLFASSSPSDAPGNFYLSVGVDDDMRAYDEAIGNNHGFIEMVDKSGYSVRNTNGIDNINAQQIEKFRYSVVDFDLDGFDGDKYQVDKISPTLYLLNGDKTYIDGLPGESHVVNHTLYTPQNKKEYFYNRRSLQMFFRSVLDFRSYFSRISFYETDMIPFFRYTTEANVNRDIKASIFGTAPNPANNAAITLDSSKILTETSLITDIITDSSLSDNTPIVTNQNYTPTKLYATITTIDGPGGYTDYQEGQYSYTYRYGISTVQLFTDPGHTIPAILNTDVLRPYPIVYCKRRIDYNGIISYDPLSPYEMDNNPKTVYNDKIGEDYYSTFFHFHYTMSITIEIDRFETFAYGLSIVF